jgi:hypothetical protein
MGVGALWYSPMGFGKSWSKLIGQKMEDMRKNAGPGYTITTIGALIQSFILANIVRDLGLTTASNGFFLGFWIWLAFVATVIAGDVIFAGRSWHLWKINAGYYLLVLLINGTILAVWR